MTVARIQEQNIELCSNSQMVCGKTIVLPDILGYFYFFHFTLFQNFKRNVIFYEVKKKRYNFALENVTILER